MYGLFHFIILLNYTKLSSMSPRT